MENASEFVCVMPQIGETVTEGTIVSWFKNIGDRIEVDEVIAEIGTDKVDIELESPVSGILTEILVNVDDTVAVGTPLAKIERQ